jgi:hypothetical protein
MKRPDSKPRDKILENEIETYLTELCEARNWLCLKMQTIGTLGFPDRCVIADGRVIFVELKRPDHVPRKAQVRTLKQLETHGAEVCVVHDADTADLFIQKVEAHEPIKHAPTTFYVI